MDDKLVWLSDVKALFHRGDERTFPFSFPGLVTERDVDSIPAMDAVEVVRCRECRYRDPEDHKCDSGEMERAGCVFPVDDDYFCAWGQRREDGDA